MNLSPFYGGTPDRPQDLVGLGISPARRGPRRDRIGVQKDEPAVGISFEAAFGPEGAVCVRHTRWRELIDLDALAARCPRLADHLGPACAEDTPALVYVRSFER